MQLAAKTAAVLFAVCMPRKQKHVSNSPVSLVFDYCIQCIADNAAVQPEALWSLDIVHVSQWPHMLSMKMWDQQ